MVVGVVICNISRMLKNEMRHHLGMMSHFTFHTFRKTYLEQKKEIKKERKEKKRKEKKRKEKRSLFWFDYLCGNRWHE
jgi:hypothetical protein